MICQMVVLPFSMQEETLLSILMAIVICVYFGQLVDHGVTHAYAS